jgi:1,4-alpha-glucan branching enzyme
MANIRHMQAQNAARLRNGTHDNPFAVLGSHSEAVRVFSPDAESVQLIQGDVVTDLSLDGAHLWVGPPVAGDYKIQICAADGSLTQFDDAYRFGPVLGELDAYLLSEGTHKQLWQVLGAHVMIHEGVRGTHFAVWAPNARRVSVIGDFCDWDGRRLPMRRIGTSGIWEIFIPNVGEGAAYKYEILTDNAVLQKADPVGFGAEHAPATASVVRDISGYGWSDQSWMASRAKAQDRSAPMSIYEVHLGSWRRVGSDARPLSYKEHAQDLVKYVRDMGFTHIEIMPVSEFPFDGSWGYQPVGLYAPTIRFGPPHEFRDLVDAAHQAGIAVLIDWVPGHFPADPHGLAQFDGSFLYEHADPREGFHQDWNTLIYNYGRVEVRNFLVANALFWLDEYHVDGLRVDAVASMLYRDYSRAADQWVPNEDGGRENYEAIAFLRETNVAAYGANEGIVTVAEESTSFPGVSAPVHNDGLGFGFKWNMGWMNDTLRFMAEDPVHRKYHHHLMTFGIEYAWSENFILPISHDEVVHGKGSMLTKMPGDRWQQFANLRAYYGFMWGHPGKKLLFMGCEFAQPEEWNHDGQLNWDAAAQPMHSGVQTLIRDLNHLYARCPALHALDCDPSGFEWVNGGDTEQSTLSFLRHGRDGTASVLVVCNFTPMTRTSYRVGVPKSGRWREILNTDAAIYGGSNTGNHGELMAQSTAHLGQPACIEMTLPGLSAVMFEWQDEIDVIGEHHG